MERAQQYLVDIDIAELVCSRKLDVLVMAYKDGSLFLAVTMNQKLNNTEVWVFFKYHRVFALGQFYLFNRNFRYKNAYTYAFKTRPRCAN